MLFVIVLAGCLKEDYTLPVDFKLKFSIDEKPVVNGMLTINTISLRLKSIDIHGYRETGDNVFNEKIYPETSM